MLVLSRKPSETVFVDVPPSTEWTRVAVTNVQQRGDKTRLGFDAPRAVSIVRKEIDDGRPRLAGEEGGEAA